MRPVLLRFLSLVALALVAPAPAWARTPAGDSPASVGSIAGAGAVAMAGAVTPLAPGDTAPSFILKDSSGSEHSLQSLLASSKLVIVDFWSTRCPFSRGYEDRLKAIAGDYSAREVKVLAVMSNQNESAEDVRAYLAKTPLPYPVLLDPGPAVADRFGAQTTPHVFVLDPAGKVRYAGGIDNGAKEDSELKPYLRQALDALLAGREPTDAKTRNFGCSIKRKA